MGCFFSSSDTSFVWPPTPPNILRARNENTEWVVAELILNWREGKKRGVLTVKHVYDTKKVKDMLAKHDIKVIFRLEHQVGDTRDRYDKTHYILS